MEKKTVKFRLTMNNRIMCKGITQSKCRDRVWIMPTHIGDKKVSKQSTLYCINKKFIQE